MNGARLHSNRDAQFRIPPPQPGSQSLTHAESGRARNPTKWRRFVHKDLVSVSGNWRRKRIPAPVSEGDNSVSRFLERASIDLRCSLSHRWARNGWRPHAIHDQRTQIDLDILIPAARALFFCCRATTRPHRWPLTAAPEAASTPW
jgi:hypothetical protein